MQGMSFFQAGKSSILRQFIRASLADVVVIWNGGVESKCLAPILPGQFKFQKQIPRLNKPPVYVGNALLKEIMITTFSFEIKTMYFANPG